MLHGRCWLSFERIPRPDPLLGFTDFQGPRLIRFHLPRPAFYSSKLLGFYFFFFQRTLPRIFGSIERVEFSSVPFFFQFFHFLLKKKRQQVNDRWPNGRRCGHHFIYFFTEFWLPSFFFFSGGSSVCVSVCVCVCVCWVFTRFLLSIKAWSCGAGSPCRGTSDSFRMQRRRHFRLRLVLLYLSLSLSLVSTLGQTVRPQ